MASEKRKAYLRQWSRSEKRMSYIKEWKKRNANKERLRLRKSYLDNREEILKRGKERYQQDPNRKLEANAKWRADNKEKMREYVREYRERNPDKHLAQARKHSHLRRDQIRTGMCDVQNVNLLSQLINSAAKLKCAICSKNMLVGDRSIDHVIPLSKGGSSDIGNLQVVHRKCNRQKYAKMPHELDGQMQIHLVGRVA